MIIENIIESDFKMSENIKKDIIPKAVRDFHSFNDKMKEIANLNTKIREKKKEIQDLQSQVKKIEEEIKHLFPLPH